MRTHEQICIRTHILHICRNCTRMQVWSCVQAFRILFRLLQMLQYVALTRGVRFLFIRATNADGNDDLTLTITITDVNDNSPVFNPSLICAEMAVDTAASKLTVHQYIVRVICTKLSLVTSNHVFSDQVGGKAICKATVTI